MAHLWEIDHPYYCNEGNYFKAGYHTVYESWADFAQPSGAFEETFLGGKGNALYDYDDDLNYLWRWDWKRPDPEDYEWEAENDPEFVMPGDTLYLFFMLQRKAYNVSVEIAVTEADEPAVREWLAKKAAHVARTWEPFLAVQP